MRHRRTGRRPRCRSSHCCRRPRPRPYPHHCHSPSRWCHRRRSGLARGFLLGRDILLR
jgi:hypothetical protein